MSWRRRRESIVGVALRREGFVQVDGLGDVSSHEQLRDAWAEHYKGPGGPGVQTVHLYRGAPRWRRRARRLAVSACFAALLAALAWFPFTETGHHAAAVIMAGVAWALADSHVS